MCKCGDVCHKQRNSKQLPVIRKAVGEEGAKSHRGNLSLAQNSIMQMRKSPDNVTLHDPKQ